MALASTQPRVTRSKRVDEHTTRRNTTSTSATTSTTTKAKSTTTTKKSTTTIKSTSSMKTTTRTTRSADPAIIDNEKENIDPLTGLDPLQEAALKKGKKKVFGGAAGGNASAVQTKATTSKPIASTSSAPKPRKSRVSESAAAPVTEDTVAGRLIAFRRHEAPSDRLARDLTVRPLVDLSEAYGIAQRPIIISETPATKAEAEEEEPSVHALIAAELAAALQVLAQTTDEHRRLPSVLQRTRGVKRAIHSPATSAVKGSTSSETNRRLSDPVASTSTARPTKRIRRSVPGTSTPKLTSTSRAPVAVMEDDVVPRAPPNTPVRTVRALPTIEAEEAPTHVETAVELEVEEAPTSSSAPIPIPTKRDEPEAETQEEYSTSFDNTQGSSHFSSVMGSFRLGSSLGSLGLGLGLGLGMSLGRDGEDEEESEEKEEGGWSRWL
ncbi:hypothetical protein M408DRAFT_329879 [Serendipita vermifera MAFF 305830]|uniref:Uncharacterized protein n=1 Tax=Serendipita vermifera MAFF 305830 TaxID=933852 RepID=A0A0C2WN60_SERVB|nr:hypothetical protein M408DRAFT_329879 [Serendipita vermifera MAFF 305830]